MNRYHDVVDFINFDSGRRLFIEPDFRHEPVRDRLFELLDAYKPGVVVKAGLGSGKLVRDIVERNQKLTVVVEPSAFMIDEFIKNNPALAASDRLRIIRADFHEFPVDYYAANLLVCVDYLDLFDASRALDEFKISIQFEGMLFYAGVVLNERDIDGVYDDFTRGMLSLHNDYYLEGDLKTFLDLKGFSCIKGETVAFDRDLGELMGAAREYGDENGGEAAALLAGRRREFEQMYGLNADGVIQEPYFIGTFMKRKPDLSETI